jgi:RecA-family ATPase
MDVQPMIGSPAERALIGAVLQDSRVFRFAVDVVAPEDFSTLQHERLFAGISKMIAEKETVDPITVGPKLGEWEVLGISPVDLHILAQETPHTMGAGQYAEIVHSEAKRRQIRVAAAHAAQGAESSEFVAGEIIARIINEFQAIQAGVVSNGLTAKTLAEVLAGTDEYDWVIDGLLESRDRLVLTGGEGAGKSTFVRQLAILSAAGIHPTEFTRIKPVRVLVVDAENSEKQWRRAASRIAAQAAATGTVDPRQTLNLVCAPRLDLTKDAHLGQVHKLIDQYNPQVLFIGPLYRLIPRAINSDDDAAPLLAALDTIRDRGIALVMEAHAGHALGSGGERDLRPRGSAALMGWPEFGMGIRLSRDHGEMGNFFNVVRWRGDRDQRDWPELMRRGDPTTTEWPWMPQEVFR